MSKLIEIVAMALGGLSLFAVCFLGFAAMSGTPLHEIAGLGELFDAAPTEATPNMQVEGVQPPPRVDPRPTTEVVTSSLGAIGAWSLPSPYTHDELGNLADELKGKLRQLETRAAELDERERRIEEQWQLQSERFEALENLRAQLEAFQSDLELRALEVDRTEQAASERDTARWRDVASVLGDLDDTLAGTRLVEYPPDEAARILRAMTPEQAATVLNQVTDRWKEYVDAYTALQAGTRSDGRRP